MVSFTHTIRTCVFCAIVCGQYLPDCHFHTGLSGWWVYGSACLKVFSISYLLLLQVSICPTLPNWCSNWALQSYRSVKTVRITTQLCLNLSSFSPPSHLSPFLFLLSLSLHSAATIFLDETLHKTKKTSSTHETEGQNSTDSGIELSAQLQDDDPHAGDRDSLIPGQSASLAVMESDVDSESDGGILSFDEEATSDQELLVNTQRQRKNKRWRIRQSAASWSPNQVLRRTQNRAGKCWAGCGACATQCINCTPKQVGLFLVARLKALLLKLLEIGRLLKDRRVILSTSLYGLYGGLHVMVNEVCLVLVLLFEENCICPYNNYHRPFLC